jgi:hypothetical protein
LGIGDWGLGIGPNPQSPIPNPQSPIPIKETFFNLELFNKIKYLHIKFEKKLNLNIAYLIYERL